MNVLFGLVQKQGISERDFKREIWPTLSLYLADRVEWNPHFEKTVLIVCKKLKDAGKAYREFAQECAEPLSITDLIPLDKILLLECFLRLNVDLHECVGDAVAFTVDDPIKREHLHGLVHFAHLEEEDLTEWLNENPSGKSEFLEITKAYRLSAGETNDARKVFRDILPFPCSDSVKAYVVPLFTSFSKTGSDKLKDFCALIRPTFRYLPRDCRLLYMLSLLRAPEAYWERFVNVAAFSAKNPVANPLPCFYNMSTDNLVSMIKGEEAKISAMSNIIFDVPMQDIGIKKVIAQHFPALQISN